MDGLIDMEGSKAKLDNLEESGADNNTGQT